MVAYKESQAGYFFFFQSHAGADHLGKVRPSFSVSHAEPLADVVQQPGKEKDMFRADSLENRRLFISQFMQFGNDLQQVPVNGVNMVNIMLGQGLHLCKFRNICPEHAGLKHGGKGEYRIPRVFQDSQERFGHSAGITLLFSNQVEHDPSDIHEARELAERDDVYAIGLYYQNKDAERYDEYSQQGLNMTPAEKLEGLNKALDRFQI